MNPADLLADLRKRRVVLSLDGHRLRYRGSEDAVTPDVVEQLRKHKAALVGMLTAAAAEDAERLRFEAAMATFDLELIRCRACGLERNPEIAVCPTCHPPAWLSAGCCAPTLCAVLRACERYAAGAPCRVES